MHKRPSHQRQIIPVDDFIVGFVAEDGGDFCGALAADQVHVGAGLVA